MQRLTALLDRLPKRELEIRRLCVRDENFSCICEDFEVAVRALQRWEYDENGAVRAGEYRQFVDEIEEEIIARLDAALARTIPKRREGTRI